MSLPYQEFITPREASKLLKVTTRTLEMWECAGKIPCIRTKGGHRRFLLSDVLSKAGVVPERTRIAYCRVSSVSQKEDLERQVEFFQTHYPHYTIVRDIGSGLNFKRKGLNSILDDAIKGNIQEIVVTHKDRLCRFGFELIERIITSHNGNILVLNQEHTSPEGDLIADLISIITVFSSRITSLGAIKNSIKATLKTPIENTKDENSSHECTESRTENNV